MALTKKNFFKKKDVKIEISFDDGGVLDMKVADMLDKYDLKATFYIVVDWVDKEGYLTWDQIKELDSRGFEIGSHTITHPQDLKGLYEEELHYEVQNSKDMIEMVLGHNITKFCYPRGRANNRVMEKVIDSGYMEARGTGKPGVITNEDKFYLPGTIHIYKREEYGDKSITQYAGQVFGQLVKEGGYCNIFAHSAEIDRDNNWEVFEEVLRMVRDIHVL